jgi:hypothetical protein
MASPCTPLEAGRRSAGAAYCRLLLTPGQGGPPAAAPRHGARRTPLFAARVAGAGAAGGRPAHAPAAPGRRPRQRALQQRRGRAAAAPQRRRRRRAVAAPLQLHPRARAVHRWARCAAPARRVRRQLSLLAGYSMPRSHGAGRSRRACKQRLQPPFAGSSTRARPPARAQARASSLGAPSGRCAPGGRCSCGTRTWHWRRRRSAPAGTRPWRAACSAASSCRCAARRSGLAGALGAGALALRAVLPACSSQRGAAPCACL